MNPRNTVESLIYKVINNVVSLWGKRNNQRTLAVAARNAAPRMPTPAARSRNEAV